jgi:predicted ArsR family transcriptional regulator
MATKQAASDPIEAIGVLNDPKRRRLYELVTTSPEPIGRDDAAATLEISRELAAFHLDRLVKAGLLEAEYRRRNGRSGPGAGRPAKLYRRATREVAVALPPRHYDVAADLMATAIERLPGGSGVAVAADVARERGRTVGRDARRKPGGRRGGRRLLAELSDLLRGAGYDPAHDDAIGTMSLRNCPYRALVVEHRGLTCGMNLAWAEGLIDGLGTNVHAELALAPDRCCVVFRPSTGYDATGTEARSAPDATAQQGRPR